MFKNALVYRIEHWAQPPLSQIEARLQGARFVECGASQPESIGWVEPRGEAHGAMVESVGGQLILKLATETKAVPGSVVKTEVQAKLDTIEKDTGRRPRGKIVKELKEEVIHALLPRAFPKRSDTLVWVDPKAQWLVVGAGSVKKADALVTRLLELLGGGCKLSLVQTALSPATAMSTWLAEKDAPAGFAIDRECELKQPDTEKASVRYARHTLDIDEVGEHIKQGKLPTQLALTWGDRVSFVLTEALTLKKIKLLDVVLEGVSSSTKDEGGFDADVALFTGELRLLIPDLVAALGGVQERAAATLTPSLATPAPGAAADEAAPWDTMPA
ncbi:MAG: recombination-associated protein RdgC [Rubrivivax sp.]|nr:recombination-associated protein RdgC [Rubrivivax sp.]